MLTIKGHSFPKDERGKNSRKRILLDELRICNLQRGKEIHAEAMESGGVSCIYLATALLKMYAKSGSMADARQVFERIQHPDVVSWTALIMGYADNGEGNTALELFERMKCGRCKPNPYTAVAVLKAWTSRLDDSRNGREECLEGAKQIILQFGIGISQDIYVQTTLINMYAKCGSIVDARHVFDSIKHPNVVSWTALILGYADNGEGLTALDLFARMRSQGCAPNCFTFIAALKACTCIAMEKNGRDFLQLGRNIHSQIGCHLDIYVQNALISMYARFGSMTDAYEVFQNIKDPNVVSWTAIISGYAENGEGLTSLELFARMRSRGCMPDSRTYVAVIKACSFLGALESGTKIHTEVQIYDGVLVTTIVDFYAKCGNMVEAHKVFECYPKTRDQKTWTALLAGYGGLGDTEAVFGLFKEMQDAGFQPNGITFLSILACCNHAGLIEKAKELFGEMSTKYGICYTSEHYTCMVDLFGRSKRLDDAVALVRSMTLGPSNVTWLTVLGACHKLKNVGIARLAFESLRNLDDTNAAAYVLMAHIYRGRSMWKEQENVLKTWKKLQK